MFVSYRAREPVLWSFQGTCEILGSICELVKYLLCITPHFGVVRRQAHVLLELVERRLLVDARPVGFEHLVAHRRGVALQVAFKKANF
jgi:hypothetical protein